MALRNIRKYDDEILRRVCRPVEKFDEKLGILLDDMYDTMLAANGSGLAAPQVGIARRVVVIDVGEGRVELINPEIVEENGTQEGMEGCLSFPGEWGLATRPKYVKVRAQDRAGNPFKMEAEGYFAVACSHEIDHLHGVLFQSHVTHMYSPEVLETLQSKNSK